MIAYRLGKRPAENAKALLADLRSRLRNRPQITTDGYAPYVDAVEEAFGCEGDYASIIKEVGFLKRVHQGNPDLETVSTSLVERCNLTVRMQMCRHARRTNAHSKTLAWNCSFFQRPSLNLLTVQLGQYPIFALESHFDHRRYHSSVSYSVRSCQCPSCLSLFLPIITVIRRNECRLHSWVRRPRRR